MNVQITLCKLIKKGRLILKISRPLFSPGNCLLRVYSFPNFFFKVMVDPENAPRINSPPRSPVPIHTSGFVRVTFSQGWHNAYSTAAAVKLRNAAAPHAHSCLSLSFLNSSSLVAALAGRVECVHHRVFGHRPQLTFWPNENV